jgi:hypothetical protein
VFTTDMDASVTREVYVTCKHTSTAVLWSLADRWSLTRIISNYRIVTLTLATTTLSASDLEMLSAICNGVVSNATPAFSLPSGRVIVIAARGIAE